MDSRTGSTTAANRTISDHSEKAALPTFDTSPDLHPPHQRHDPVTGGVYRSRFDFTLLKDFAADERGRFGLSTGLEWSRPVPRRYNSRAKEAQEVFPVIPEETNGDAELIELVEPVHLRRRRFSQSAPQSKRPGGKLALFEFATPSLPPFDLLPTSSSRVMPANLPGASPASSNQPLSPMPMLQSTTEDYDENKPYRFAFYSDGLRSTIPSRSCSLRRGLRVGGDWQIGKLGCLSVDETKSEGSIGDALGSVLLARSEVEVDDRC